MLARAAEVDAEPATDALRRRRSSWAFWGAVVALLVVAGVIRALPVAAGRPYIVYVDEGHVLHYSARMIAQRTWDPEWYRFPSFVINATTLTAAGYGFVAGDDSITDGARTTEASEYYDVIEPPELVLAGRVVVLVFAIGTVLLTVLLGLRLMDRRVGIVAGVVAAALPALVSRSAIVITDTPATFFATASLLFAASVRSARRPVLAAIGAGSMAGLAFASKYPVGAAIIAVLVAVALWRERSIRERLKVAGVAVAAAIGAAVLAMPALVVQPRRVRDDIREIAEVYEANTTSVSFWRELLAYREVGLLVLVAGVIGLLVLLRRPGSRPITIGYLLFAFTLSGFWLRYSYQPLRNVLPLLPFLCVAVAAAILRGSDRIASVMGLARRTRDTVAATATVLLVVVLAGWGVRPYLDRQLGVVDTRIRARQWVDAHVGAGDDILVAEELAFLPRELRRMRGDVVVRPSRTLVEASTLSQFEYIVAGDLDGVTGGGWARALERVEPLASYGFLPTPAAPTFWRGPDQIVRIYRTPSPG